MPTDEDPNALLRDHEKYWRDHHDWLQQSGYALRPRYRPDWVPSWKNTKKFSHECEDGRPQLLAALMDATRTKDGAMVMLKRISKSLHPYEVEIGQYFSSEPLSSDSRNHCVPFYEILQDPTDEDTLIIVMPLLRRYIDPTFLTVGEAVECFRQLFEGLHFMHEHHVAHRDCMTLNVMLDPRAMYPDMYHPRDTFLKRDYSTEAKHHSRTKRPTKYYFTDFGISRRFAEDDPAPRAVPIIGGDSSAPEFREDKTSARDPFPTDVYYIGNMIREDFQERYSNLSFMDPLVTSMIQPDPSKRPTMAAVQETFNAILAKLSRWKLYARLVKRTDGTFANMVMTLYHVSSHTLPHLVRRLSPMPTPLSGS